MGETELEPAAWLDEEEQQAWLRKTPERSPRIHWEWDWADEEPPSEDAVPLVRADQLEELIQERIEELEEAMEIIQEKFDMPHGEARLNRTIQELEGLLSELEEGEVKS